MQVGIVQALTLVVAVAWLGSAVTVARQSGGRGNPEAAKIGNPVPTTPESIAAGDETYRQWCAACHGQDATGGIVISLREDRGLPPPPSLVDDEWDHGSTDGEIFYVIKKGVQDEPMMSAWEGRLSDTQIWNVVNYLRSLAPKPRH